MINTQVTQLNVRVRKTKASYDLVPANEFTLQQLTDIYNETRVDYVVPMPMSQAKMREYIEVYDVDLSQSVVATSKKGAFGLGFLGRRGDYTWVTRLGITPKGRKKGVGRKMMDDLIHRSYKLQAKGVILEVIKNNNPARTLFESLGFQTLRELLVIRRPPTQLDALGANDSIKVLGYQEALNLIETRTDAPSWVTANPSLKNAGNLSALVADLADGGRGWLVYQNTVFQLSRVVIDTQAGDPFKVATHLLRSLHTLHPAQDTVVENLPADDIHWPAFKALGYLTSFVRIEMKLDLQSKPDNGLTSPLPWDN
ncbi:MAG: GNAT family N-acetyltransferase [Anaerolineae bacterium]|nr:GNAT family N-acetyltransferase [Anaerolineae bacterium]